MMYFFYYMCLYIGTYLYYQWAEQAMPAFLPLLNKGISAFFLLWGAYGAGRIIIDCLKSYAKGEMIGEHMRNGILMSVLYFLPTLLLTVFMLREGFIGK